MTLNIELPPEVEASFAAQARAKGVSLDTFIRDYLIKHALVIESRRMSANEIDEALEELAASMDAVPPLSEQAMSRESIYTREDEW